MRERVLIDKCLELIEEKMLWGNREAWTNYHYTRLSEQLSEETGIYISLSTIKRLFKNNADEKLYNPQLETKNALSIYLGFKNWNDFEKHYTPILPNKDPKTNPIAKSKKSTVSKSVLVKIVLFGFTFIVIVVLSFLFIKRGKFYIKWKTQKEIAPITAYFNYKIPKFILSDCFIDFGDDQKIFLSKDKETIAHFYKLPYYYKVKLYEGDKVIDSTYAVIPSNGWIKGISNDNKKLYISKDFAKTKRELIAHQSKLDSIGIDDQRFWVQYRNFGPFKVLGDNMTLETLVKNNSLEGGIDYNDIEIKLIGEYGNIELFFIRKGLSVWTKDIFSEVTLDGTHQDLSAFGQDFSDWKKIKMEVRNKKVAIYFDHSKIYTTSYNKSIGKIKGVIFNFRGFGDVQFLNLWDAQNKLAYRYHF